MIGVLVNVVTVVIGSLIGLLFKKGIPQRINNAVMTGIGVCTLYIGIDGSIVGDNILIAIASVVTGVIVGTLMDLDGKINCLAKKVEDKFNKGKSDSSIAEGLIIATLLFCVGSMTVTGSIQAGLTGDNSVLFTKATLDLISSAMLASSLGIGVLMASISVFVIQGGLVVVSKLIAPVMSIGAINEMTCVGSLLIIMLGLNLMGLSKFKVADFLPSIIIAPVIYNLVPYIAKIPDFFI